MARRKDSEKNVRKLTRIGRTSLAVTIPIDIVRDLKWRERQKVVVEKKGKTIMIRDWKGRS